MTELTDTQQELIDSIRSYAEWIRDYGTELIDYCDDGDIDNIQCTIQSILSFAQDAKYANEKLWPRKAQY